MISSSKVDGLSYSGDGCTTGRPEISGYGQIIMKSDLWGVQGSTTS